MNKNTMWFCLLAFLIKISNVSAMTLAYYNSLKKKNKNPKAI